MPYAADAHGKGVYLFLRMHLLPELHGFDRCDLSQLWWRVGQASDSDGPVEIQTPKTRRARPSMTYLNLI